MKKVFTVLTILVSLLFASKQVSASHLMGADISYTCLGSNQYQITLSLYRDCSGITLGTTAFINYNSASTGMTGSATLNQVGTTTEVTPVCPAMLTQTTCSGGLLPGVQQYVYQGVITLPGQATDWIIDYNTCCRNGGITTIPGASGLGFRVEALINNVTPLCDNSPIFTSLPVPFVCVNQPFNYNQGAYDVDGDSLVYAQIYPMDQAAGSTILYSAPWSSTYPLTTASGTVTFDPATGQMTFTPSAVLVTVVAIRVDEYRSGQLIGSTMRDMQLAVLSCTNQPPSNPVISNVVGGQQTGPTLYTVCPGQTISFNFSVNDPDPNDTLNIASNIPFVTPSASFTFSGTNPISGNYSWQPSGLDTGFHNITLFIYDNACPIIGQNYFSFQIYVSPGTSAGPDQTICGGGGAQLNATGGSAFTWAPATGLSCTSCQSPLAAPAVTTSYTVTSNLIGNCNNVDTVVVFVTTPYTYSISNDTSICQNQTAFLHITGSASGAPYTYNWTPNTAIIGANTATPAVNPNVTTTYYVTITSAQGCSKQDSVVITIAGIAPVVVATASQYQICPGQSTNLSAGTGGGSGTGTYCTPTYSIACSSNDYIDNFTFNTLSNLATGCNGNTAPMNYIYYNGGPTTTVNVGQTYNFSVQSGTTWSQGSGIWIDYNQNGSFADPGEFIYASPSAATTLFTGTTTIPATAVPGVTRMRVMCRYATTILSSDYCNPSCSFGECEDYDITIFAGTNTYAWTPTTGLSNSTISNPVATPTTTTTYTVTVTNNGFCDNSDTVVVTVNTGYQVDAGPDQYVCIGSPATLNGSNGVTYSWSSIPTGFTAATQSITVNPTSNTQYVLLGTDPIGCQDYDTAWVYMNQVAGFSAGNDAAICQGGSYTMQPVGNWVTYNWAPATGLSATNIANPVANPAVTTTYTLMITDANGCAGIDSMVLTVNVPIVPTVGMDTTICYGQAANIFATPGVTFSWLPTAGLSNSAGSSTQATPVTSTTYTVTVTDVNGCISTGQVIVGIFAAIPATAGNDTSILPGLYAQLNATNPAGVGYSWTPIDYLSDPNIANPLANPPVTTTYQVAMMDTNGCIATDDVTVIIQPACQGVINANAFTPNGDGLNDQVMLIHQGYDELVEFSIYNRWGAKIFSTNRWQDGWDGTFNGLPSEIGTYVWVAHTLCDGKEQTQSGDVTLIR